MLVHYCFANSSGSRETASRRPRPERATTSRQPGASASARRCIAASTLRPRAFWVTGFSGKPAYREMRGFAGRDKQPQPAACILGLTGANIMRLSLRCRFPC